MSPRALACPASLKHVLSASAAAEALARGLSGAGVRADVLPVADGGEGTVDAICSEFEPVQVEDAFGRPRVARTGVLADGTRVFEAAEAIPLDRARLDVMAASSRGLGLWMKRYRDCPSVVAVGGTATMDAGANVHVICDPDVEDDVADRLEELPVVGFVIRDGVGNGPDFEAQHLF